MSTTVRATFGDTAETFMIIGRVHYRLDLVIVWSKLLFGAFLRFEGKGSSQPLPSPKYCVCTPHGGIC